VFPVVVEWCDLSLKDKIILILGVSGKPILKTHLEVALFLMDKIFGCEKPKKDG